MLLLMTPLGQALAADITVDADCSLENAIRAANEVALVEPLANCETGDANSGGTQVDENGFEIPAGLDVIALTLAGTADGVISLNATLPVTSNIVIEGGGFVIDGAGNQIFNVSAGSLSAYNLTIRGGWTDKNGGAIAVSNASLTLSNSVVGNSGAKALGGGIYALDSNLALFDSVVSGNVAGALTNPQTIAADAQNCHVHNDGGAGAHVEEQCHAHEAGTSQAVAQAEEQINWDAHGGGIYFEGEDSSLVIARSGLLGNSAYASGGGLYVSSGSATITNSTMSENAARADGGALFNGGSSTLTHLTVVDNKAANTGGLVDDATLLLYNSIVSDNAGGDCRGALNASIGNLIRDLSCNHDGLSADPNLLRLSGAPPYYLPQAGSPALDAASPDYCLPTDQRGILRDPNACDIGAAEHQVGAFSFQIQSALAILSPPAGGGGTDDAAQATPEPALPPTAAPSICSQMPAGIVMSGYQQSTACKVVDAAGVGNKTVIDWGFIQAVDIFGDLSAPVKACFQHGPGFIILLDAANSPRNIVPLNARLEGDMLCADITRAGTVVLMPLNFVNSGHVPNPSWDLRGCAVTTTAILNLRSESNSASAILGNVLNDVQLTADRKENNYYRVNYYQIVGWLSADYLIASGNC